MDNYITHLHAKNIGVFEQLDISFNKGFNFIVGPNGSGKTSILKCLALTLAPSNSNSLRYGDNSSVWFDAIYNNKKYRIGLGEGWVKNYDEYRHAQLSLYQTPPQTEGVISMSVHTLESENINIAPLTLGAYRRIEYKKIEGTHSEPNVAEYRKQCHSSALKHIEGGFLPDVKQWLINRYYQTDKDWAIILKRNWDWILQNLNVVGPTNCSLSFKQIKRDHEPMFTLHGIDCYLEETSAGFQAVLSLVFAIVEWIEGTNDEEHAYIPDATGTVIIDELDVHLHPEWQLTIRNALATLFPNLQFIITTHSPHLIATAEPGELIVLPELSRTLSVVPTDKIYSGWNTDQILEEVMGVKNLENKMYNALISQALQYVSENNAPKLGSVIEDIKKVAHPSDTILQVLQIKLAALELEGTYD